MARRPGDSVDRREARRLAKKRASILTRMKPEEVTVEMWLSSGHLLFPETQNERTRSNTEDMLRPFRRAHGETRMVELTALKAQAWALKHPSQVRFLREAWTKAVLMQIAPINVWLYVVLPPRTKEKRRPPTEAELAAILARTLRPDRVWLRDTFREMIIVAAYTGARQAGLMSLAVADVDLKAERMVVTEKGEKTRTLAVCGPAHGALTRSLARFERRERHTLAGRREPLLWVREAARTPLTADIVQKAWREIRGEFPHGFHSLKHYAATWLRAQGVSELDAAIQLGHTDAEGRPYVDLVRKVYDHPDPEAALARISKVVAGS